MGKPHRFLTDALEMFKTTGVASDIADKQIVIDLLRCYNELGAFDNSMSLYYDQPRRASCPNSWERPCGRRIRISARHSAGCSPAKRCRTGSA